MSADGPQLVKITAIDIGDSIELSCTFKDEPTFDTDITEHAVEGGSNVTDHARPKLALLTLEGLVSSTGDQDPVAAERFMEALATQPQVVKIETPRRDFEAMLLQSFKPQRTAAMGAAFRFTAIFKEFKTVNTRKVVVEVKTGKPTKKGAKAPVTVGSPVKETAARKAVNAATGGALGAPVERLPGTSTPVPRTSPLTDAEIRAAEG